LDKLVDLEIVSPVKSVFKGQVKSVSAPGVLGGFQVLYNHAPLVSTLGIGKVKLVLENGSEDVYAISGGIFEVNNNKATILAEEIESKDEIDLDRARAAKERAEQILRMTDKDVNKEEARETLKKAQNRLEIAEK
jgi:F-type H+-transporting ATPase subunit epsilon